jgi:hypothetical protein
MSFPFKKEKLNGAFFLLSIIIIIILALLLFKKRFGLYFKKPPFSLKLVKIIGVKNSFKGPAGIAFGKRNNLYVVDSGNSRIMEFNIKGHYIRQWGIEGKATGEFMIPLFAAAYGNPERIYVVDSGNSRIETFKPDGDFISEFGNSKNSKRILAQPTFIGFTNGKIYVANSGMDEIMIYLKNGQFYQRIGNAVITGNSGGVVLQNNSKTAQGKNSGSSSDKNKNVRKAVSGNGNTGGSINSAKKKAKQPVALTKTISSVKFKKPVSIAFSKKYIYVSDYSLSKILVFNKQFDYIGSIGTPGETGHELYHPVGIAYKNGYLYVANYGRSILTVFKLDDGYDVVHTYNFGTPGTGKNNFNHESNISISFNGKYLAVADTDNNRILIYRIFGSK